MVSEGRGAELVDEEEARAAMQRGEKIVVDDAEAYKTCLISRF